MAIHTVHNFDVAAELGLVNRSDAGLQMQVAGEIGGQRAGV